MRLLLVRTLWGFEDRPDYQAAAVGRVAESDVGYQAVASPVQPLPDVAAFASALEDAGLGYVPQLFSWGRTVDDHLKVVRDGLERAAGFSPPHVVAQLGRDGWPLDVAVRFLADTERMAADLGVALAHETHRGRILFTPWVTEQVLQELPEIELALDLSHWTCVGESMRIPDRILDAVAAAARHVDCRVGYEEGPQVPDPRSDRYGTHLSSFEGWWDRVWAAQAGAGSPVLAMAPEFGPPPYQPVDPWSGRALADVNELNDWMAHRLQSRYGSTP